jgi:GT2 family glycosyltransferase
MDNDVVVHSSGWVEELEEAIARFPKIGIIGLKRKDLAEHPNYEIGHHYKSNVIMVPHEPGQRWIFVEEVKHVMGTCQMYNYKLIDKMGGLYQMDGIYGFDDSLASIRCTMSGFKNVFLPHINIDHIDTAAGDYTEWKKVYAGKHMELFTKTKQEYIDGDREVYYPL